MTTAQEFYDFFNSKPEESWGVRCYNDGRGHCCALGHLGCAEGKYSTEDSINFERLSGAPVPSVNDGFYIPYNQPTPKQRILALCKDLIAQGK